MSLVVSVACFLLTVMSLQPWALGQQLGTDPVELAVEPGEDAEFTCVWLDGDNATKLEVLHWLRIMKNPLTASAAEIATRLTNSSRIEIGAGAIVIKNVTFADAGKYKCEDDTGTEPVEVELIVYEMPNYWTEGGVLIGLSAALLVLLGLALTKQLSFKKRKKTIPGPRV